MDSTVTTDPSPIYDVSPDGRFIFPNSEPDGRQTAETDQLVVVDNWFEELKRLAPSSD